MGGGDYSFGSRQIRTADYQSKTREEIFSKHMHESMDPKNIKLREARDSDDHPNTVPIILALDETGSMGHIPEQLIKEGLPHMMEHLIERGIKDPAVLFLAIGDAVADHHPLQVGQFESSDELLDTWLERAYLEGNGGGNGGESYHLAYYFAANHTVTDAWEKRGQKGFLITTGDEPCHRVLGKAVLDHIMPNNWEKGSYTTAEMLEKAQEKWHVIHIHMTHNGAVPCPRHWKEMLGENCIEVDDASNVAKAIANAVVTRVQSPVTKEAPKVDKTEGKSEGKTEVIL